MFVGTFDKGTVHAVVDQGGKKVVKPFITGLRMPTGVAFQDGALYVVDIDKLYRTTIPRPTSTRRRQGKVVYDDFPPYVPHGWKYLVPDGKGWFYIPVGVPCNICLPPTSTASTAGSIRKTGAAEIVALGVRNSVGGAVDPRTGQLWFTENGARLDQRRHAERQAQPRQRLGEHFGYPYCHQGDLAGSQVRQGAQVLRVHAAGGQARPAHRAARHEVLYRQPVPGRVQERHLHRRARLVEPHEEDRLPHALHVGRSRRQEPQGDGVRRGGWLDGQKILGRPADILQAPDGSLLVADDQAGAIYQISYRSS